MYGFLSCVSVCICGFGNVWVYMRGFCNVCVTGFYNLWECVCVGFVMCGCVYVWFCNVCVWVF